jgi:predicted nucleic acid-binding protein
MRHLLDTNVWIDALSGKISPSSFIKITVQADWAAYSSITRLELFGFPEIKDKEEAKLTELLNNFIEISVDSKIIDRAIVIRKKIKIKVPDAIIAASALENECFLVTHNIEDFKNIAGLTIIDPYTI